MKWLLEDTVFEEDIDPLKAEIIRQGMEILEEKYIPFEGGDYCHLSDIEGPVIFYGSLNMARHLKKFNFHNVYIFNTVENYECQKYYAYMGQFLLNARRYMMLPFSELKKLKNFVFETVGCNGSVFVRPNSVEKGFTGQVLNVDEFEEQYELLGFYDEDVKPESLVVAAYPEKIAEEFRLVICDMKVISGSQYKAGNRSFRKPGLPVEITAFAERVLAETQYEPDMVWVMDICRTIDGNLAVLEIGGFSCAGLYYCPVQPIVENVSKIVSGMEKVKCQMSLNE